MARKNDGQTTGTQATKGWVRMANDECPDAYPRCDVDATNGHLFGRMLIE